MDVKIESSWKEVLKEEFDKDYFKDLTRFVREEYQNHRIYPPAKLIFSAFDFTPFQSVKLVIIGQDPYHGQGQANGLCFSVNNGVRLPPSLLNIYKELKSDLGIEIPVNGNLESWAKQGVLLLNATLTVRSKSPGSHQDKGWEQFTDAVIQELVNRKEGIVYILWGAYAQKKGAIIPEDKNFVIKTAHPSPFSANRGFLGSKPFSKSNAYLRQIGKEEIDWRLVD